MQLTYCDVCHEFIKTGDKKYILGVNPMSQEDENVEEELKKDIHEYVKKAQKRLDNLQIKEICEECKKVLEHLFSMRQKELFETKEEIKKLMKNNKLGEQK